jgi:hypothetical protein
MDDVARLLAELVNSEKYADRMSRALALIGAAEERARHERDRHWLAMGVQSGRLSRDNYWITAFIIFAEMMGFVPDGEGGWRRREDGR